MFNQLAAQLQTFQIAGAGPSIGDTTLTLVSFSSIAGIPLTMAAFGSSGFMTVEPGSGMYEEQVNFTGITANIDGTVTLTGISNVSMLVDPTSHEVVFTSGFAMDHAGGVNCCVSNTSGWYGTFANRYNAETIHQPWTFNAVADGANPKIDNNSYSFQTNDYITKYYAVNTLPFDSTFITNLSGEVGSAVNVYLNGTEITASASELNFTGGWTITKPSAGIADIAYPTGGGGGTINPATTSAVFDDFIGGNNTLVSSSPTTSTIGELSWNAVIPSTSQISTVTGLTNHPGVFQLQPNASSGAFTGIFLPGSVGPMNAPSTTLLASVSNPSTPIAGWQNFFGLCGSAIPTASGNYESTSVQKVGFIADGTSGNWIGYASDGTTQNTTSGTPISGTSSFDTLSIAIDSMGANAVFSVNGSVLGTIAIPSGTVWQAKVQFASGKASGTGQNVFSVDYFSFARALTR